MALFIARMLLLGGWLAVDLLEGRATDEMTPFQPPVHTLSYSSPLRALGHGMDGKHVKRRSLFFSSRASSGDLHCLHPSPYPSPHVLTWAGRNILHDDMSLVVSLPCLPAGLSISAPNQRESGPPGFSEQDSPAMTGIFPRFCFCCVSTWKALSNRRFLCI